jgi:glycosyltransferase involved in cell wall biosynthesis
MSTAFFDYFRCSPDVVRFHCVQEPSGEPGYFRLGEDLVCYGKTANVPVGKHFSQALGDGTPDIGMGRNGIYLPFDPDEAVDNLRFERYPMEDGNDVSRLGVSPVVRDLYYVFRPLMPVPIRSVLQRAHLRGQLQNPFPNWPVDRTVDRIFQKLMELQLRANGNDPIPFIWFWPEGKRAALVITHDVESSAGVAFCPRLMDIDSEFGFRASFQLVPEKRYEISEHFLREIRRRGFEVNVHDLNHDGNLFRERDEFLRRATKINQYAAQFGAKGFRSGALYRRLEWFDALQISYDMSVPNVAHLDPQIGGCCTIMPYFVGDILELPVTETQDYSIFHILKQYSISLWKQQSDIIIKGNGMINIISHPDYLIATDARSTYRQLLAYLADTCRHESLWATLPGEIDHWWRMRNQMRMVRAGSRWEIRGNGSDRARIAYASLVGGKLAYTMAADSPLWDSAYVVATKDAFTRVPASLHKARAASALSPSSNGSEGTSTFHGAVKTMNLLEETVVARAKEDGIQQASTLAPDTIQGAPSLPEEPAPSEPSAVPAPKIRRQKPLRVCMVAYTFYESDNRVMRYAETLVQEGHEVEVLALRQPNHPKAEMICGVHVHRLQGRVVNEKNQFSYAWRIWAFLLRAFYHVSKNDWKQKYDLIHVHSVPDFLVFCALIPRLRGTPVILDIHDILPEFYLGKFGGGQGSWIFRFLTFAEKVCANCASHVIIANHIWRERLIHRSVSPDRCTVVLNSPDRSIFHSGTEALAKRDRFLLLYPGTLNWHQGLDIAIRAFAKISARVPHVDFHIYGEGPSKPFLADLIKQLRLDGRVVLQESRRIREIALIMETADLGIVPKRKDNFGNEAFSTKIFEFMAMNVPVIVSDTKIDRYYFNDSLVRFFKGGDEDDLARCMLDLIQDPEKRRELVRNASEFIGKNDWIAKKQEYLDLVAGLTDPSQNAA